MQQGQRLDQQSQQLDRVDRGLEQVSKGMTEIATSIQEIKAAKAAAREAADANGDGKLDPTEMLTYGGLLAAALAEMARRKMKALQGNIDDVNGRVDFERSKRKAAEADEIAELRRAAEGKA